MKTLVAFPRLLKGGNMGKKIVVEIKCDRCTRVEHKEEKGTPPADGVPIFSGTFLGEHVEFGDLCGACTDIVMLRWAEIVKELTKASPHRDRSNPKKSSSNEALPRP